MPTFVASVGASSADDALQRVGKFFQPDHRFHLPGFALTGRVAIRSEKHLLWNVEVENQGGNVNEAWVILTSYGISPNRDLGSHWGELDRLG